MCYSAMVEQNAKKIGLKYKARVQTDLFDDLFTQRLAGEKIIANKGLEYPFLNDAVTLEERAIGKKIRAWHESEIARLESALAAQNERLSKAQETLKKKETKKALEDRRIATDKIEKFARDIEKHRTPGEITESDQRIFPFHYMAMLCLDDRGERVVRPMRYLLRPRNKDESFESRFGGCYNARYDSLESVPWWKDAFGKRHGLILVTRFFENVSTARYLETHSLPPELRSRENIVLCFEPAQGETMLIPTLWDVWEKKGHSPLYSAALITDDPAPEVAEAGHDRTPIFLREDAIDDWLRASDLSPKEIKDVLSRRQTPYYKHRVLGAA